MADTKISALTSLAGSAVAPADDVIPIVDTSVTTTKKITVDELDTALWNKSAHTVGANYTSTRAMGAASSGVGQGRTISTTLTGNVDGTSNIRGVLFSMTENGSVDLVQTTGIRSLVTHSGSGAHTTTTSMSSAVTHSSTGASSTSHNFAATYSITGSGGITTADHYSVEDVSLTSTGAINTLYGFNCGNIGHATLVSTAVGFNCNDITGSATLTAAFLGAVTSGTNKYNLYMSGTAQNYLAGVTGIGAAASSTSRLLLAAGTTGVSSLRIPHGSAPTSPVDGDIWTTSSGLYVRINGSTVGPLS